MYVIAKQLPFIIFRKKYIYSGFCPVGQVSGMGNVRRAIVRSG